MQEVERWHDFRSRSKIKCGRMQCAGRTKCMGVSHFPRLRHGSAAIIRRRRQNVCQSKQNKREKCSSRTKKGLPELLPQWNPAELLSKLDGDSVLILALMAMLYKEGGLEGCDKKLLMALAYLLT